MLFLADEIYNHKYGTFLANCERDRDNLRVFDKTESIWTYVLLNKHRFTNRFYDEHASPKIIPEIPVTSAFSVNEWRELHFKWTTNSRNIYFRDCTRDDLVQNCFNAIQIDNKRAEIDVLR